MLGMVTEASKGVCRLLFLLIMAFLILHPFTSFPIIKNGAFCEFHRNKTLSFLKLLGSESRLKICSIYFVFCTRTVAFSTPLQ